MYLLYFFAWIAFNGKLTLEIALFGLIISSAMFAFTCKFMDYSVKKEISNFKKIGKIGKFAAGLFVEIVKANFVTIRLIFSQKEEIVPVLVSFTSELTNPVGKALLANAITLTPGTITVAQEDDRFLVHCLDESMSEGLKGNELEKMIKDLE